MKKIIISLLFMLLLATSNAQAQSADIITLSIRDYYSEILADAGEVIEKSWALLQEDTESGSTILLVFEAQDGYYYIEMKLSYVNSNKQLLNKYKIEIAE